MGEATDVAMKCRRRSGKIKDLSISLQRIEVRGEDCFLYLMVNGVLKVESFNEETMELVLTVEEDLDCSGLPVFGETVCNYDEGFISGIFEQYANKEFKVREVDCWTSGERVCRFKAERK
ncbi:MAG TPA: 4-vinyl reductase [Dissulfurispiraceae bacterium]|nr:4-vinyl reductase [Dissulfurispiraceae bacterium]